MTPDLILRYQPGGDIYAKLAAQYGYNGAETVARAARTGVRQNVTVAIANLHSAPATGTSTIGNFVNQITTDPLAAPLASANSAIGTVGTSAIVGLFKNPWVLALVAGLVFYALGGFGWLGKKVLK